MTNPLSIKPSILQLTRLLLFILVLGTGSMRSAQASHFRYGNITWTPVASDPTGRTIQFRVSLGFRKSYPSFSIPSANIVVGATLNNALDNFVLNYGDGTPTQVINFTVTSVNDPEDQFYAEATLTHTYASSANFTAFFQTCCRIAPLQNNSEQFFNVNTVVTVGNGNSAPVSTLPPIVNLAAGLPAATFQVPASDPNGDALTFALATPAELGGITFVQPTGLTISPTGQITFNTSSASNGQFYNAVVKITDARGARVILDFLIRISGTGTPPAFVYGPTPANGSTIAGTVGTPVTFTVRATDSDPGDVVTISGSGIPLGATFSPSLPVSGTSTVSTTFSFTPTAAGTSVLVFTATDASGGQVQTSVTIQVGGTTPPPPPQPTGCGSPTATIGQPLQLVAPTYNCTGNGTIIFNTVGGNGSPIEYQGVPGVSVNGIGGWNASCQQLVDAEIRTAGDAPVMVLQARQNGVVVSYSFDLRAVCPVNRPGPPGENQSPGIVIPIPDQTATQGTPFSYTFPPNTFIDPDGDPMTYTAAGLPMGITFAVSTFSGTPTMSGTYSVTVTATDGSILSGFDVFILTVNPTGGMPVGFAFTGVNTISCNVVSGGERQLTFNPQYSGLNGQPITFSVVNESLPTTAPGPYTLRLYTDNPTVTLKAAQGGTPGEVTFAYNWLTACGAARRGVEPTAALTVKVLGNPVLTEMAEVEVRGAAGQPLRLQLVDGRGYGVSELTIKQAGTVERATLRLGHSGGVYYLKATTGSQKQVVKIVKQ